MNLSLAWSELENSRYLGGTSKRPTRTSTLRNFQFHGPDGFVADYGGLTEYFRSIREAFDDRSIRRGMVVAEGNLVACQTWIEGTFVRPFTQSPAGPLEPTGARVIWDLMNIFRFDDLGRLVKESSELITGASSANSGQKEPETASTSGRHRV